MNVCTTLLATFLCCIGIAAAQPQQQDVQSGPIPTDTAGGRQAPFMKRPRPQRPPVPGIFRSLDSALATPDSVLTLLLRDKGLVSLPKEVAKFKNLKSIDLSGNKLTSFPTELLQLPGLAIVDLSNNTIKSVPADISKMTQLTRLNLKNTGITTLPASIGACKGLVFLDVSRNPLISLPIRELNALPQLRSLLLGNSDQEAPETAPTAAPVRTPGK